MNRRNYILSALTLIIVSLMLTGKPVNAFAEENTTICKGVFIDQVDVSNMTKDQANTAVKEYVNTLNARGIAITVGKNVVYTTMGDMGYKADASTVVDEAMNLGKSGNLIKRYKDLKDIEQGKLILPLDFTYDKSKIKEIVSKDVSAFNVAPVNASVMKKKGKLVYTDQVVGSKVNVDATTKTIEAAIENWNRMDLVVNAVVEDDLPQYTKEDVMLCNTLLGSYTTEYRSSAWGRAENLANGARLINNTVLYPGETFSAYEHLSPFTKANGYQVAGAYLKGKVIDSVGGGACQVTTTLYNSVLKAELEVVERQNHSMTISYVDLSRDAAIAGTSKDFKFKNNTDAPILIEASTYNRTITFKLWGHETRDTKNRTIKFVSQVISKTNPPKDVITKDPTKPTTYKDVTTPAHIGYKAKLWKVVYENGVQTDKILINTSNYQAAARCITVGTKVIKPDNQDTEKDDTKDPNSKPAAAMLEDPVTDPDLTKPDDQIQGDTYDPSYDMDDGNE